MVDKSLSRGLADRVLDEMTDLAKAYGARVGTVLAGIPRKRHAVQEKIGDLTIAGEKAYLAQVVSSHPKWRWASTCAFIPYVREQDAASERIVAFLPLRTYIHVDRPGTFDPNVTAVLAVSEHAIERLFQRLNARESVAVREELHDAIFMAIHLLNAARQARLLQVVLPTQSGAFLCSVDANGLVAKTWIASPEAPCRHTEPARLAKEYFRVAGGEHGLGAAIGALPMEAPLSLIDPPEGLPAALSQIAWLREPYSRRADPVGDAWRNARAQQHHQLAAR
jgi:hypothetical protein